MTTSHFQPAARQSAILARPSVLLPDAVCAAALRALDQLALGLVSAGISANTITSICIALGAGAGVMLALGQFGIAATLMVVASLGDALDGLVARRSGTSSVGGALLDASGDRYQEFFFLGGLAMYFRASPPALLATLAALAGSFMVSYGSAKAEALAVKVPPGAMRRAERAVCLCLATAVAAFWQPWAATSGLPGWAGALPLLIAVGLIAVVANVSAIRRMRLLARGAAGRTMAPKLPAPPPAPTPEASSRDLVRESSA
ncbi:MAG TPA: CDP-alcohol phosphatidyltransferase family protein [Polyangiaceae bacterium]|jgi:CDP-diacylglycerol--glycerol-3-phosphate 3-phosphatidyltransferase|nr:CDP-alcohol phosphatidyltransferase family protein [Polyangiaceae bacterium]